MKMLPSCAVMLLVSSVSFAAQESGGDRARQDWPGTTVASPNGEMKISIFLRGGLLQYAVALQGKPVIENSAIGITVDEVSLGASVEPGKITSYQVKETFAVRGVHSTATNQCEGKQLSFHHTQPNIDFVLDVRAYDDGIAFRTVVPGPASGTRVPDEATVFTLPAGSTVWYHGFRGHYEGRHAKKLLSEMEPGEWAAPPLTFQLPESAGYGSITEAALVNFSGMGLQATGHNTLAVRLGHAQPASYPFVLRYGEAEAARLSKAAAISGDLVPPWRVVIVGSNLNFLVKSDIVTSLNPPPDRSIFPQSTNTTWTKPGRAVWKYLDDKRPGTVAVFKEYSDEAHQLGFEYNVVEGVWTRWSPADLKDFIDYSRARGIGIFLWKHSRELHDPAIRHSFFQMCHDLGVAGVKIDFFDHEAKEVIDLYNTILKETAELGLMVNFHGANKPTGESRTWPNEITREAVAGMEGHGARAAHDATLPFTRFLAGPADYTPVLFSARREDTTWAHQIATAVVFTSPLLTYGADPKALLESPAVEIIKAIPSTWDETLVLSPSSIGELAVLARRRGTDWFLAAVNGPGERDIVVPLSFLSSGGYRALLARDGDADDTLKMETGKLSRGKSVTIHLRKGGGFVARFYK